MLIDYNTGTYSNNNTLSQSLNLEFEINRINKSNSDYIHIDIMDGAFVESDTRNLFDLNRIKKISKSG